MYLIFEKVLVSRSSSQIYFFKRVFNDDKKCSDHIKVTGKVKGKDEESEEIREDRYTNRELNEFEKDLFDRDWAFETLKDYILSDKTRKFDRSKPTVEIDRWKSIMKLIEANDLLQI